MTRASWRFALGGSAVLALVLSGILALKVDHVQAYEDAMACNNSMIEAKAAYGADHDLEIRGMHSFLSNRPTCVDLDQVHKFSSPIDTAPYYLENKNLCPSANDSDPKNGIDTTTLFFYTGHGLPNSWQTQGPVMEPAASADTACMQIGNPEERGQGGGRLRYYWKCSCQVFAHGPEDQSRGFPDYRRPDAFNAGRGDANVLETWAQTFGSNFRLACGSSTRLTCEADDLQRVWLNKKAGFDVADSFIAGLHSKRVYIPICLAKGSAGEGGLADPRNSPLYDKVFTVASNPYQDAFTYIEYVRPFDLIGFDFPPFPIPERLVPEFVPTLGLMTGVKKYAMNVFDSDDEGAIVRKEEKELEYYHNQSAAMVPIRDSCPGGALCRSDYFFISKALDFLDRTGWREDDMAWPPFGARLLIDAYESTSMQRKSRFQKGIIIQIKRKRPISLPVRREEVEVEGSMTLSMNNDGEIISGWKRWKTFKSTGELLPTKSSADARAEAVRLLGPGAEAKYSLTEPRLAYRMIDSELVPIFVFDAEVVGKPDLALAQSRRLEVLALLGE